MATLLDKLNSVTARYAEKQKLSVPDMDAPGWAKLLLDTVEHAKAHPEAEYADELIRANRAYARSLGETPIAESAPNECCRENSNLKEIERREAKYQDGSDAGPLVVYQCRVCQRKHYVHEVKPFVVGVALAKR